MKKLRQKKNNGEQVVYLEDFVTRLYEERNKIIKEVNKSSKKRNILIENDINKSVNKSELDSTNNSLMNIISSMKPKKTYSNPKISSDTERHSPKPSAMYRSKLEVLSEVNEYEIRENGIRQVFNFYCNQHANPGKSPTFDKITYVKEHMDISCFYIFCKDFKVNLDKSDIDNVFFKNQIARREIDYNMFKKLLSLIGLAMRNKKMEYLKNRIQKINARIGSLDMNYIEAKYLKNDNASLS